MTCPALFSSKDNIMVNGSKVFLDFKLTCKTSQAVYLAQCQLCGEAYFGQTVTPFHVRMNGHRDKFVIDRRLLFERSALSYHNFLDHKDNFSLSNFKLGIVKKVNPVNLNREEQRFIDMFRTDIFGLNRIKVVRS